MRKTRVQISQKMRFLWIFTAFVTLTTAVSNSELRERYMTSDRIFSAYECCTNSYPSSNFFTMEKCIINKLVELASDIDNVVISFPEDLENEAENHCLQVNEDFEVCIHNYKMKKILNGEKEMSVRPKSVLDSLKLLLKRLFRR